MKSNASLPVFIYSPNYNMDLGGHVFPAMKFGLLYERLKTTSTFKNHLFLAPLPASPEQALLAHDKAYIDDFTKLRMTPRLNRSELPLNRAIVDAFFLGVGGTIYAANAAVQYGSAMNIGGGFHHAFADHAEGFCYLNDVAIAAMDLRAQGKANRFLIIDLDVHQGNGTAKIFKDDENVFTFSMHEENNYPIKESSDLDIGLESGCNDEMYLRLLKDSMDKIRKEFEPDVVFYVAGVDPFEHDRLGGLSVTKKGMLQRDTLVKEYWSKSKLVTVLAGGYAINTEDTIDLHFQTCEVLAGLK